MKYADLQYLLVPLPEAIAKEKWAGHYDKARKRIAAYLEREDTELALRRRLELELVNLDVFEERYTVSEEEALAILKEQIPDMTAEELEKLRMEDKVDWMYVDGKVRYIDSFRNTLIKVYPQIWERAGLTEDPFDFSAVQNYLEQAESGKSYTAHIHIRHELRIGDAALKEGAPIRVHMPLPQERDGISNFKMIHCSHKPAYTSNADAPQPTIYFEEKAEKGQIFVLEYELDNTMPYRSVEDMEKICKDMTMQDLAPTKMTDTVREALLEEKPHIVFTPYLRALCEELKGDETNPLKIARRFYDFVTIKEDYRFMREYSSVDSLTEYSTLGRRGDCGILSLVFITLCRIAGIPAQWQSGLEAEPNAVGEHDWAMFYLPELGWMYSDLSGGSVAYERKEFSRWNFFFGNVDPYRIPTNNRFQRDFYPEKKHWRKDPYDNQCGEIEYEDCGVVGSSLIRSFAPVEIYLKK